MKRYFKVTSFIPTNFKPGHSNCPRVEKDCLSSIDEARQWIKDNTYEAEETDWSKEHNYGCEFLAKVNTGMFKETREYVISGYRMTDDGWTKTELMQALSRYIREGEDDYFYVRFVDDKLNELGYELDVPKDDDDVRCKFVIKDKKTGAVVSHVS